MKSETKPSWARRQYLINPGFQWTVIGFFVGMAAVTILVFGWAFRLAFGNFVEQAKEMGLPDGHPLFQLISNQQHAITLILMTTSILMFLFLVIGGIVLSHHIAGPVYRLKKQLEALLENDEVPPMSFRKKDFFHELPPLVNALAERLKSIKQSR